MVKIKLIKFKIKFWKEFHRNFAIFFKEHFTKKNPFTSVLHTIIAQRVRLRQRQGESFIVKIFHKR